MSLALGLILVACNSLPRTTVPPSGTSSGVLGHDWRSTGPGNPIRAQVYSGTVYLSDLQPLNTTENPTENGWGPYQRDTSNGEKNLAGGNNITNPLRVGGKAYAKGLGVHATSNLVYDLSGSTCTTFSAEVGVDDEVGALGSVEFQVMVDGQVQFTSGVLSGQGTAKPVSVNVTGAQTLKLAVTNGDDNFNSDHADWSDAKVMCGAATSPAPGPQTGVSTGFLGDQLAQATDVVNGWGPVEVDMENGDNKAGDGGPISLSGVKYAKGLGVHAPSSLTFPLGAGCTAFKASVGLDDVVRPSGGGSVGFQVFADDEKLFESGVMRANSATQDVNVNLAGRKILRLDVTDGGDHIGYDHADWANARVECQGEVPPVTPPVTPPPTTPPVIPPVTPPPTTPPSGPLNRVSYSQSFENFRNPERGDIISYQPGGTDDGLPENTPPLSQPGIMTYINGQSSSLPSTLLRIVYVLGQWRDGPLPQSFLDRLTSDMATAREAGLKVTPYFAYTWPLNETANSDAPTARILSHLDQLKPVLQANGDVIAFMFSGFIGSWGEWHTSTNNNLNRDNTVNDNTRAITNKLLDVLPQNRAITLRYPGLKYQLYGKVPLTAQEAFTGSPKSRIGFNNECYMADYHPDVRTLRLADRPFLNQDGLYVPQAELLDTNCFTFSQPVWQVVPCPDLIEEMTLTHPDAINQFNPIRVEPQCQDEVKRRTGYRYRLLDSQMPGSARAGTELNVTLNMTNDGFGGVYNPRGLELVLRNKSTGQDTRLTVNTPQDTRLFLPAPGETKALTLRVALPAGLASGQYDVLLALPDPAPSLHDRPAYAIQLANQNVWEARSGFNALGQMIDIQP